MLLPRERDGLAQGTGCPYAQLALECHLSRSPASQRRWKGAGVHALVLKNNEVFRAPFIYMKMMAEVFFKEIRFIVVLTMGICQCAGICMRVPVETRLQIFLDLA